METNGRSGGDASRHGKARQAKTTDKKGSTLSRTLELGEPLSKHTKHSKKGRGIKQSNLFRKFSRNTDSTDESSHGRPPGVLQTPCVEKGYRQQQKQDKKQNLKTVQAIKKTRKKRSSRAFSKNAEQHKGGNVSLSPPLTEDASNESSFAKRQKGR